VRRVRCDFTLTVHPEPVQDPHVLLHVAEVGVRAKVAVAQLEERGARQQRVRPRLHAPTPAWRRSACPPRRVACLGENAQRPSSQNRTQHTPVSCMLLWLS
jgi:hypothetical protein